MSNSKKGETGTKKLQIQKKPFMNIIGIGEKKQIEQIIGQMDCIEDFKCYKSGLKDLSKVRDIGIQTFVECLEENSQKCKFSLSFGYSYFCQCPLRVYIAKKLYK